MKCKFYRGPWHGKVVDVSDRELERGYINIVVKKDGNPMQQFFTDPSNYTVLAANYDMAQYDIKIMSGTIAGHPFSGPAVHPDGSLFLEYSKPRRK